VNAIQRRWLLTTALVGALAAAGWVASQDQVDSRPEPRSPAARVAPRDTSAASRVPVEVTSDLPLDMLKRAPPDVEISNIFTSRDWQPPPPKVAAKPPPPPPPSAPPMPFTVFGQMVEDGRITVFLNGNERSHAVKVGDVINKAYRVDMIKDGVVVLTYLPLNQQQTLRTGTN
jgi:hypothetical protein